MALPKSRHERRTKKLGKIYTTLICAVQTCTHLKFARVLKNNLGIFKYAIYAILEITTGVFISYYLGRK